jgi:eukaryotic-like serine/threonine-protein kinase
MEWDGSRDRSLPLNERDLFTEALRRTDPAEQAAYLDQACGRNPDLRRRLEELLACHARTDGPLDGPPLAPTEHHVDEAATTFAHADPDATTARESGASMLRAVAVAPGDGIGTVIAGRYTLVEEIGEGGMGTVFLASQTEPVRRQVAIKLIKAGMDSRAVLARFDSERQALALMDHPNIAKVLDAGATDLGRPFFVMEHVKGIPLTDYCDQHRLGVLDRLALFRQICSAVQHAHQKGIIHRDLKPTNILVESHDDKPVPKVIDFGLAKATGGLQLTEQSLYSGIGTVAGTPLYMAPEQASFNAVDIDTRADIYALGVILYELLTGSTPIERETFRKAAIDEMLRIVRDVEPPMPSSRISKSETRANVAATRQTEPARLGRFVRGDLDWIVMKALSKERQRRYESPIAFSLDIERFLNHEPVSAGPPTAAYLLRKFVRRNRGRVIAASLVLLALVGGIVGTTLGLFEANRQKLQAEKRLVQVEKANGILGSIFQDLDLKKEEKDGKPLLERLGERLNQATEQIEGEAIGDPLTVAHVQQTLGKSQLGLGYPERAIALLTKARATFTARLGPRHPNTLGTMNNLAQGLKDLGKYNQALPLLEETLALRKATLGPEDPDTLSTMQNLASGYRADHQIDRALPLFEETFALMKSKLGPDHSATLVCMGDLAGGYIDVGKFDRAVTLLEEVLRRTKSKLGPDHLDTIISMNDLAYAYQDVGRLDRSVPLFEESLARARSKLGHDHPVTLTTMNNLAEAYRAIGKLDRALSLYEEAFALYKTKRGLDHPATLNSMSNLAMAYQSAGNHDRALPLFEEALAQKKSKLGDKSPVILPTMSGLALSCLAVGQTDRAMSLLEESYAIAKSKLGPDDFGTLHTMHGLARGYDSARKFDRSIPLFEECLKRRIATLGRDHPATLTTASYLGVSYKVTGRLAKALPLLEQGSRAVRKYPNLRFVRDPLLDTYVTLGRSDLAAALVNDTLAEARAALPQDSPQLAGVLANVGSSLLKTESWAKAETVLREAVTIRDSKEPGAWGTFNTKSMLGAALVGQLKYAEAEPLVIHGYEEMKAREATIPATARRSLYEATERVVRLYEAWGKREAAAKWKAMLGLADLPTDVFARP